MTRPLVIGADGRAHDREKVLGRARALLDRLELGDAQPALLPLCSRYGDFMSAVVAARSAGLPVILPNDSGAAAVNSVIAETGDVIVLASAGDGINGFMGMLDVHVIDPEAVGEPLSWGGETGGEISLFTSGTTGVPVRHTHSFRMLDAGAKKWRKMLGMGGTATTLVCTVPPQHMYGLEASIMLPLTSSDIAIYDVRPFFAANIADALEAVPPGRVLVSTPMHLDLLVREDVALPPLDAVVSATSSLDPGLAAAVEEKFSTRVVEVFGTTETGLIGSREPARNDVFTPRDDLEITFTDQRMSVMSTWRAAPLTVDDTIEPEGGGFRHIGRGDDLINVAGKRASLAGLTQQLRGIDGVRDGMFVMPGRDPAGHGPVRPVAFVVAPDLSADQVRRALRERVAQAFVPRRVVMLDAMPKSQSGKTRIAALLAMLSEADGRFSIPSDHPALAGHFPGNPIVPGAVVLDHALRAAGMVQTPVLKSVKFVGVLRAREDCIVETSETRRGIDITCRVGDRPVMRATLGIEEA